ncbi:MAG: protein kinase [Oligosphaeraceae bacterium]
MGESFAGYRILEPCGRGFFGEVFLAEDMLGHKVALKRLMSAKSVFGEKELEALKRYMRLPLHHSICHIHHCGWEGNTLFYVMEPADNALGPDAAEYRADTLALRMKRDGAMPLEKAVGHCLHLLDALEVIHQAGLTHRDVKPENILFVQGRLKLADFGLLTEANQTLSVAGTPGYMPPELLAGTATRGVTCDIYAVGKILYAAVTGNGPEEYPALPPGLSRETLRRLCHPVLRLCAREPERRCGSVEEARRLLQEALLPASWGKAFLARLRMDRAFRKRVALHAFLAFLLMAVLAAGGGHALRQYRRQCQALLQETRQKCLQLEEKMENLSLQFENPGDVLLGALDASPDAPVLSLEEILPDAQGGNAPLAQALSLPREEQAQAKLSRTALAGIQQRLGTLRQLLRTCARNAAPVLDEEATFDQISAAFSFLDSPLGRFLPEQERQSLLASARHGAERLADSFSPRLGEDFLPTTINWKKRWVFIPAGAYYSPTLKRRVEMPRPFWILNEELNHDGYYNITGDPLNKNKPAEESVNNLSGNDILLYCKLLMQRLASFTEFPEGYAFRPPTELEWEYVAMGGWRSKDNPFPVMNLTDACVEACVPAPELLGNALDLGWDFRVLRGKRYPGDPDSPVMFTRRELAYKDTKLIPELTYRPVLAWTPDDFFSREWLRHPLIRTAELDGRIYAGYGFSLQVTRPDDLMNLARLLGARLPEPPTYEACVAAVQAVHLNVSYPNLLGIQYVDGAWRWLSSGEEVGWKELPPPPKEEPAFLMRHRKGLIHLAPNGMPPAQLLEWTSREAFDHRLDFWKDPWKHLTPITLGTRTFAILPFRTPTHAGRAVARFLNTKLALPTEEELQELLQKYPKNKRLALGAYLEYNRWVDDQSTPLPPWTLPVKEARYLDSLGRYCDSLVLENGELREGNVVDELLLELPPPHNNL